MQILTILVFIIIATALYAYTTRQAKGATPQIRGELIAVPAVVVGAGLLIASSIVIVPFGSSYIVTQNGALTNRVLESGLNFKTPFIQGVWPMNTQMRALEIDHDSVFTSDQQNADNDYVINFQLDHDRLTEIAQNFRGEGSDTSITDRLIRPRAMFYLKQIEPEYNSAGLLSHRADVATKLQNDLDKDLAKYGVRVAYVSLTNISFGPKYQETSEERAAAEQQLAREAIMLNVKKVQAQQAEATAEGIAKSNAIIRQSFGEDPRIADDIVRLTLINKLSKDNGWDGHLPPMVGGGALLTVSDK